MIVNDTVGKYCQGQPDGALYISSSGFPIVDPNVRAIGNPWPDWTAGISLSANYKGFQLSAFLIGRAFWLGAVVTLVAGLGALRGGLPRWYSWASCAAAVLLALGGLAVKQHGFFAPAGGMAIVAFVALNVWVLATSVLLWQAT